MTSTLQTVLNNMPPTVTTPLILSYGRSTVPLPQLARLGEGMSEQERFDAGQAGRRVAYSVRSIRSTSSSRQNFAQVWVLCPWVSKSSGIRM